MALYPKIYLGVHLMVSTNFPSYGALDVENSDISASTPLIPLDINRKILFHLIFEVNPVRYHEDIPLVTRQDVGS